MPERRKPLLLDAKGSIVRSCRAFGSTRSSFFDGVVAEINDRLSSAGHDEEVITEGALIASDLVSAIQQVFESELRDYVEKPTMKASIVVDGLFGTTDDRRRNWAPYFGTLRRGETKPTLRGEFVGFNPVQLDPFNRFSMMIRKQSPAKLAFDDLFAGKQSSEIMIGQVFEAIVSSHAAYKEVCFSCKSSSLQWCGGSDTSWKDMFCTSCHSCFEIKSKADKKVIGRISDRDELQAGSFRRWCDDRFPKRGVNGKDYIVFVSREPSEHRGERGWAVYIAQVGTVLPALNEWSFAQACGFVTIRSKVTLARRPELWFHLPVPIGDQVGDLPDIRAIFRHAFEAVFPDRWTDVGGPDDAVSDNEGEPHATNALIEQLQESLDGLTDGWDDEDEEE